MTYVHVVHGWVWKWGQQVGGNANWPCLGGSIGGDDRALFTFLTLWFFWRVSALTHKDSRNLLSSSMLILCLFRPHVLLSILATFKPIRKGLLACLPATLLILT